MVEGKLKSRTYRRVFRKTPGAQTVIHYIKRKPRVSHCSACGKRLQGIPRGRPYEMQNMPKTKKRPERPFGGTLCSACARKKIIEEAHSRGL
jgi:large subunit ribosomal protein L34e